MSLKIIEISNDNFDSKTQANKAHANYYSPSMRGEDEFVKIDKSNNGKFDLSQAAINFAKGFVSPVVSMFTSLEGFVTGAAILAGSAFLVAATGGAAAPLLVVAGITLGTLQAVKAGYQVATAKNGDDFEKACFDLGSATSLVGLSALGAKSSLRQAKTNYKNLSILDAVKKCFTSMGKFAKESIDVFRTGHYRANLLNAYELLTNPKILKEHSSRIYEEARENYKSSKQAIVDLLPAAFRPLLQGRVKSKLSIYEKLVKERKVTGKDVTDEQIARALIQDDIGARLTLEDTRPQTIQKLVDALVAAIRRGDIEITEIENYKGPGNEFYFSQEQINAIKEASPGKEITISEREKPGGYTATHLKVKPKGAKTIELQIRGKKVSGVADWEHIIYDLRHKKDIARNDNQLGILLAPITKIIKGLSAEQYEAYQKYIIDYYAYAQKLDNGIAAEPPKFPEGINESLKPENLETLVKDIENCIPSSLKNPINLSPQFSVASGVNQSFPQS